MGIAPKIKFFKPTSLSRSHALKRQPHLPAYRIPNTRIHHTPRPFLLQGICKRYLHLPRRTAREARETHTAFAGVGQGDTLPKSRIQNGFTLIGVEFGGALQAINGNMVQDGSIPRARLGWFFRQKRLLLDVFLRKIEGAQGHTRHTHHGHGGAEVKPGVAAVGGTETAPKEPVAQQIFQQFVVQVAVERMFGIFFPAEKIYALEAIGKLLHPLIDLLFKNRASAVPIRIQQDDTLCFWTVLQQQRFQLAQHWRDAAASGNKKQVLNRFFRQQKQAIRLD